MGRNPFEESQRGKSPQPDDPGDSQKSRLEGIVEIEEDEEAQETEEGITPKEPDLLGDIPVADWQPKKRERDRSWEQKHKTYVYRGIHPEIRQEVKTIAQSIMVSADEVAAVFLQYALACLEDGTLQIQSHLKPKSRRRTLFPDGEPNWRKSTQSHSSPPKKRKRRKGKKEEDPLWKKQTGYRVQEATHEGICKLANAYTVSNGEVVSFLLGHSIEDYWSGKLILDPQPVTVKMTLSGG